MNRLPLTPEVQALRAAPPGTRLQDRKGFLWTVSENPTVPGTQAARRIYVPDPPVRYNTAPRPADTPGRRPSPPRNDRRPYSQGSEPELLHRHGPFTPVNPATPPHTTRTPAAPAATTTPSTQPS